MLVALRTFELIALLALAGLPLSWALLGAIDRLISAPARVLLAPLTGLACLAIGSGLYYAFGVPIDRIVGPFWLVVALGWIVLLLTHRPRAIRLAFRRTVSLRNVIQSLSVALGLILIAGTYLWPFLQDGRIVFWHYAGSDGYMYMRIAEFVGDVGTGQTSTVGIFDAATGWVHNEMLLFHTARFVDKPATMGAFAALSALLGLLPHETFSPLVVTAVVLLYLSLLVFARWIRLHVISSTVFAAFGALGMVTWMMGTSTFLGNALALPFFPMLLPLGRPRSTRLAAYAGLVLGGLTLVFPDGMFVVIGLLAPYTIIGIWQGCHMRSPRRILTRLALGVGVWLLPTLAFGGGLAATLVGRLDTVLARNATGTAPSAGGIGLHALASYNWVWPAFNLNVLPPEPVRPDQFVPLILLGASGCAYALVCAVSRRTDLTVFGLLSLALLLVAGAVGGVFRSDYEFFRALAVLFFVPLAVVFALPGRIGAIFRKGRLQRVAIALTAVTMLPILAAFGANDRYQFDLAYTQHLPDAQYTADDLVARRESQQLLGSETIVVSSETPSFTALANIVMLFSTSRVAVSNAFLRFFFFSDSGDSLPDNDKDLPPRNEQYTAALVLRNMQYGDIFDVPDDRRAVYHSEHFAWFENDLIPFFDNDTFAIVNPFPLEFLRPRRLAIARVLSRKTDIPFFSAVDRYVSIQLAFDPASQPGTVTVEFDGRPAQASAVDTGGVLRISGLHSGVGLHTLTLGPVEPFAQVTSFRLVPQS